MAIARKPRKHPAIIFAAKVFSRALAAKDYALAAKVTLWCVFQVDGVKGIMDALYYANSAYKRMKLRESGISRSKVTSPGEK